MARFPVDINYHQKDKSYKSFSLNHHQGHGGMLGYQVAKLFGLVVYLVGAGFWCFCVWVVLDVIHKEIMQISNARHPKIYVVLGKKKNEDSRALRRLYRGRNSVPKFQDILH
ncbi:transmembrane protein, putative [Medicago truncatula]|uniref:Transmembrane protein, putative n=1 Tax=Medicago truncatula TaxID=3880 RepID=A0A072UVU0_MEDTR|nr:transmembrane protein, putative [Medicago truncatula]